MMNFDKKFWACAALVSAAAAFSGCSSFPFWKDEPAPVPVVVDEDEFVTVRPVVPAADVSSLAPDEINDELDALAKETEKLQLEKSVIESALALAASEQQKALLSLQLEKIRLDSARAERAAKFKAELAGIESERADLESRLALEKTRAAAALSQKRTRLGNLELELRELQAEVKTETIRKTLPVAVSGYREELSRLAPAAAQSPKYLKEPLVDGTLYVSERRIALNGPITDELAKSICSQIYFYNNQNSEFPIFIVIDNSPGGSVAAGYQIQKAMKSSKAPVYVVVKTFAASMAAVIATTAERSYCYENTRILHHQISTGINGNLTVLREGVEKGEEWYSRFCEPVAKKMGLSLDALTKEMYAHNSDGDWSETGKRAVELKWIDNLVARVEETGVISIANAANAGNVTAGTPFGILGEKTDAQGSRFVELPELENPFDFWAIYDKNNYYRVR